MLSADTLTADVVARVELADGWLEQIFDDFPLPEEADLEPDDREMECDDFINSVKIFAPGGELSHVRPRARARAALEEGRTDGRARSPPSRECVSRLLAARAARRRNVSCRCSRRTRWPTSASASTTS